MKAETAIRALADPTRLRIMRLLAHLDLAVGELAQVLGQSQPRVSRHVAILCDTGLASRHLEGSKPRSHGCSRPPKPTMRHSPRAAPKTAAISLPFGRRAKRGPQTISP